MGQGQASRETLRVRMTAGAERDRAMMSRERRMDATEAGDHRHASWSQALLHEGEDGEGRCGRGSVGGSEGTWSVIRCGWKVLKGFLQYEMPSRFSPGTEMAASAIRRGWLPTGQHSASCRRRGFKDKREAEWVLVPPT